MATAVCPVTRTSVTLLLLPRRLLRAQALDEVGGLRVALSPLRHDPHEAEVGRRVGRLLGDRQHTRDRRDVVGHVCTVPLGSVLVMMFAVTSSGLL